MVGNNPSDRRAMASAGPFTFHPGDVQDLEVAFSFARDYTGTPASSVDLLKTRVDSIRKAYMMNVLPNGQSFNGIYDGKGKSSPQIGLYPNPANHMVTIDFHRMINETLKIEVVNMTGKVVLSYEMNPESSKAMLNVSGLSNGMYVVTVNSKGFNASEKMSISR
jgi:hypothetical protein